MSLFSVNYEFRRDFGWWSGREFGLHIRSQRHTPFATNRPAFCAEALRARRARGLGITSDPAKQAPKRVGKRAHLAKRFANSNVAQNPNSR